MQTHEISHIFRSVSEQNSIELFIQNFRNTNQIKVYGNEIPAPYLTNLDLKEKRHISGELFENLNDHLSSKPTALQSQVWPIAINKQNLVVCANQEPDRILSYILPALSSITEKNTHNGPVVLILSSNPTYNERIMATIEEFSKCLGVGNNWYARNEMKAQVDVMLTSPKYLTSFLLDGIVNLDACKLIIFDEIDEMLSTGEHRFIYDILQTVKHDPQFLVFTSTWSLEVRVFVEAQFVSKNFDYIKMVVGTAELTKTPIESVKHHIHVCRKFDKISKLREILESFVINSDERINKKAIVFVKNDLEHIEELHSYLVEKGFPALRSENEDDVQANEKVWKEFIKIDELKILVTCSSLSYLCENPHIKHVIIYDCPTTEHFEAEYLFQISRAGYIPKYFGNSHLLYTKSDIPRAQELIDIMRELKQNIDLPLHDLARIQLANEPAPRKRLTQFTLMPEAYGSLAISTDYQLCNVKIEPISNIELIKIEAPDPTVSDPEDIVMKEEEPALVDLLSDDSSSALLPDSTTKFVKFSHVVEVLMENDKLAAFEHLLTYIIGEKEKFKNFKMIVYTEIKTLTVVMASMKIKFPMIPISIIPMVVQTEKQQKFQHGVFFNCSIPYCEVQGLDDINIIVNYDYPKTGVVENPTNVIRSRLSNVKSNHINESLAITFFCSDDMHHAKSLVDLLVETEQPINALLSKLIDVNQLSVANKLIFLERNTITVGSMNSFTKPIDTVISGSAPPLILQAPEPLPRKNPYPRHYVEVLLDKDKNETLLDLLQNIYTMPNNEFCKTLVIAPYNCLQFFLRSLPANLSRRIHFVDEKQKADFLPDYQHGILCLTPKKACYLKGIRFRFVINRQFPISMDIYRDREALCEESMITFFAWKNREQLEPLVDILKKRKKQINPLLAFIKQKISRKMNNKNRERFIMHLVNEQITRRRIDIWNGNIKSFLYDLTTRQTSPNLCAYDRPYRQYFEVLTEEDKPKALLNIVKHVFCEIMRSQKIKMLVFIAANDKTRLITYLDQELGHLCPPIASTPHLDFDSSASSCAIQEQIVRSVHHGILFLTQFDFRDTNHRIEGIKAVDFVINYDYPECQERQFLSLDDVVNKAHQTYLKRISNLSKQGCAVTLFTAKNYNFVKSVVEMLNKESQEINPLLIYLNNATFINQSSVEATQEQDLIMQNVEKNICKNRSSITIGNLKAFYKFFENNKDSSPVPVASSSKNIKADCINDFSNIRQFVEVMEQDSKPSVLFGLIKNIFCKGPRKSNIKMIVFASADFITSELRHLQKELEIFSPEFCPPVYSVPNYPKPGERKHILNAFRDGVLLLKPADFKCEYNITGIDDVNIVINYHYPNQTNNFSAASKKFCEKMYLNKISNIKPNVEGFAITFFAEYDHNTVDVLINTLQKTNQRVNPLLHFIANLHEKEISDSHFPIIKEIREQIATSQHTITEGNLAHFYSYWNMKEATPLTATADIRYLTASSCPSTSVTTASSPPDLADTRQFVETLYEEDKQTTLLVILSKLPVDESKMQDTKILVFAEEQNVLRLTDYLMPINNPMVLSIPANADDVYCERILHEFGRGKNKLLIISDATYNALKLGINGVNWVINFDYPLAQNSSEIYKNRISNLHGNGFAITLFTPSDVVRLEGFLQVLNQMKQTINPLLYEIKFSHQNTELLHEIFSRQKKSNSIGDLSDFCVTLAREKKTRDMLERPKQEVINTRKRPINDRCAASTSFANKRPRYEPNSKLTNTYASQQKTTNNKRYYINPKKNFQNQKWGNSNAAQSSKIQKQNASQGYKSQNVKKQIYKAQNPNTPQNPKKQTQNPPIRKVQPPKVSTSNGQNLTGPTTSKTPKRYYYNTNKKAGAKNNAKKQTQNPQVQKVHQPKASTSNGKNLTGRTTPKAPKRYCHSTNKKAGGKNKKN